jgi:hypothetical protein
MEEQKTVTVPEDVLKKMIADLETLKAQVNGAPAKPLEVAKDRYVNLRFIDNKPIIGFKNRGSERTPTYAYTKPDPNQKGEQILMVDVFLLGEKEAVSITHADLRNETESYKCKIVKIKEEPWTIDQGEVEVKDIKYDKYRSEATGEFVPARVEGVSRTYIVEDPIQQGNTIELSEKVININ